MAKEVNKKKGRKNKNSTLTKTSRKEKYNIDNEIVIGLNTGEIKQEELPKKNVKKPKKNKTNKIIKYMCIAFLILIAVLLFFMSPIFTLEEIEVKGNNKISTSECINLSGLEIGQNIYKMNKRQIKNNIRQNAYANNIYISRKLPNKIEITIEERVPSYMLEMELGQYAYINNQGYILEKSYNPIDSKIITGFSTQEEKIIIGKRLCDEDLKKLEIVIKIIDSAKNSDLLQYITKINIEDKTDYILIMEEEKKTVHLGDASSISTRMLYLKAILEKEKGIEGDIFINGNINEDKAFFREKV